MEQLIINGGKKLKGNISVSGAKNAALAIIPACILCNNVCTIENVPNVNDVKVLLNAMEKLGIKIEYIDKNTIKIDTRKINSVSVDYNEVNKIRASYYLIGSLLGRFKEAEVAFPGGCNIGNRPIDQHIKGFEALGAKVTVEHGIVYAKADKLVANNIYLDVVSVGATINTIFAAVLAEGTTIIENAAKEPHIVDVANFLNSMGADVKGAGTDVIKVYGVKKLHGAEYMVAAAITGGDVTISNLIPKHMEAVSAKLKEIGVQIEEFDDAIRVYKDEKFKFKNIHVKTLPYPGFPTDMQPQITTLLANIEGTSIMTEGVWESRFQYIDELNKMGANIKVESNTAIISGVKGLTGAEVKSTDLRAGAALVLAGLVAEGETIVHHVDYIDRGYEHIEEKLRGVGADIYRCSDKITKDKFKVI